MPDPLKPVHVPEPLPVKDPESDLPVNDPPASKITTEHLAPITVAMIGTGDGRTPYGVIETPGEHKPNLLIMVVSPLAAILIRFANSYVTALLGLVTVGLTTDAIPAADFYSLVVRCAGLSLAGPCVALGKDLVTILGNLEKKYPLLTGSI